MNVILIKIAVDPTSRISGHENMLFLRSPGARLGRGHSARQHRSEAVAAGEARDGLTNVFRSDCPLKVVDHFEGSVQVDAHRNKTALK